MRLIGACDIVGAPSINGVHAVFCGGQSPVRQNGGTYDIQIGKLVGMRIDGCYLRRDIRRSQRRYQGNAT